MADLAIDLYCGLGGWAEGFLAEGWRVIGFDNEPKDYPGQLVLQDVTTLDGARFRHASLIVASPPCQAYSYRAMPWKRAKALPPPDNTLFEACFRIQREASAAARHHLPMILENACGAQKRVVRAKAHYGSYYLWGDIGSVGGVIVAGRAGFGVDALRVPKRDGVKNGNDWFSSGAGCSAQRRFSSRSAARKHAQAVIAKIPFPLARHIAQVFREGTVAA